MADVPPALNERARSFWARTTLHVWPEHYFLVSFPTALLTEVAALMGSAAGTFAGLVAERDEVSLTIEEQLWLVSPLRSKARTKAGPYRAITFDVNVDLDVVGYLAPAALALAKSGVSIVPQCAYLKDHLLVHERSLDRAIRTLTKFIQSCGK